MNYPSPVSRIAGSGGSVEVATVLRGVRVFSVVFRSAKERSFAERKATMRSLMPEQSFTP